MPNRGYEEREVRLALEWASLNFPKDRTISRYRILAGEVRAIPGFTLQETLQLMKPTGLLADLVIVNPSGTYVIEAKTDNETQAIGQLLYYVYLMKKYPGLQEVPVDVVYPIILLARSLPDIVEFAQLMGVAVAFYSPPWIQEFLRTGYSGGP